MVVKVWAIEASTSKVPATAEVGLGLWGSDQEHDSCTEVAVPKSNGVGLQASVPSAWWLLWEGDTAGWWESADVESLK